MSYFLAVDAGGTKAEYLLADGERILAQVFGGTIKRMRAEEPVCADHLAAALAELQRLSGVPLMRVTRTCIGTAGNTVPLVTEWLRRSFSHCVGGELLLLGDVEIALDAAFPGTAGVLILAGTGSNVAARSTAGTLLGAGGYGPALADQASGHRIGTEALRALFLARDEARATSLLDAVLMHWSLANADDLVAYANAAPLPAFSTLVPAVLRCAEAGDAVANEVLAREARELAHLALLLHGRLCDLDGDRWQPRFACAGSILEHVTPVRTALEAALRKAVPHAEIMTGVVHPAAGALWRARGRATQV